MSEVIGDIQPLIASALGVSLFQLDEMMEKGIKTSQVLPKVAAQLRAQNALLASSAPSAQKVKTRFDNSLLELQNSVGKKLQPVQKMILNWGANIFDFLETKVNQLVNGAISLLLTAISGLAIQFFSTRTAVFLLGQSLDSLLSLLNAALPKIILFLKRFF